MKASELREQTDEELRNMQTDLARELWQARFDNHTNQLDDTSTSFYSATGLRRARAHLTEGGVLGVWSYAENSPFADALREVFRKVRLEEVSYENAQVGGDSSDWLFFARD